MAGGAAFGALGLLGKLPSRAEFVRLRSTTQPFSMFDDWIARNMEWAERRGGAPWPNKYSSGAVQAFAVRTRPLHDEWLAGALRPSFDRSGRRYPFVAAAPFRLDATLHGRPQALPLVLEGCWELTGELACQDDLDAITHALDSPIAPVGEDLLEHYDAWTKSLSLGQLWRLLFGTDANEGNERVAFLGSALRPPREAETFSGGLMLRVPLGAAGGAGVCFWIDLVCRLCSKASAPSFFWTHDGESGSALLILGEPPASTLEAVWKPDEPRDDVCDLTTARDALEARRGGQTSPLPSFEHTERSVATCLAAVSAGA